MNPRYAILVVLLAIAATPTRYDGTNTAATPDRNVQSADPLWNGTTGRIFSVSLDVPANRTLELSLRNLSNRANPMIVVLGPDTVITGTRHPGSPGPEGEAVLRYAPDRAVRVEILAFAPSQAEAGTFDLESNLGRSWRNVDATLAPVFARAEASDELRVVAMPHLGRRLRVIALELGGARAVAVSRGEDLRMRGAAASPFFGMNGEVRTSDHVTLRERVRVGSVVVGHIGDAPIGVSVLVNRTGSTPDSDGDGLSDPLERALGTCARKDDVLPGGFACGGVADPRDTDSDGLTDRWEVFGKDTLQQVVVREHPSGAQSTEWRPIRLAFPRWGASPRHKDLFVELDYMLREAQETPIRPTPEQLRAFVAVYEDSGGRDNSSGSIKNPDRMPGIATHVDAGVEPTEESDAARFGDWGGYSVSEAVRAEDGTFGGVNTYSGWKQHLHWSRKGIFHHAFAYSSGGGQAASWALGFAAGVGGLRTVAHEGGHTLTLGHSAPTGSEAAGVNCKPQYMSAMNYAYQGTRHVGLFAVPPGAPLVLQNSALDESRGLGDLSPQADSAFRQQFDYRRTTLGAVDWNRDGVIAPPGTKVRAYANLSPRAGGGCEYTRLGQTPMPGITSYATSLALVEWGTSLLALVPMPGAVQVRYAKSTWPCAVPSEFCGSGSWGIGTALALPGAAFTSDIDAVTVTRNAQRRVAVVIRTTGNRLAIAYGRQTSTPATPSGSLTWSVPSVITGTDGARGIPSVTTSGTCDLLVVYKVDDRRLMSTRNDCVTEQWSTPAPLRKSDGAPMTSSDDISPTVLESRQPRRTTTGLWVVTGDHPSADRRASVYVHDATSDRWIRETGTSPIDDVHGRVALAYVPDAQHALGGVHYLVWRRAIEDESAKDGARVVLWARSHVTDASGTLFDRERIGLRVDFDNTWYSAFGVDVAVRRQGPHHQLTYLDTRAVDSKSALYGGVFVRPWADGITTQQYRAYDDWLRLSATLCEYLRRWRQAHDIKLVSPALACPAIP